MQARWVIAGTFAVVGAYWLAMVLFLVLRVEDAWWRYAACALAVSGAGALMVAHAPLRPWREPAAAGVLAVALVAVCALAQPDLADDWFIAPTLHSWSTGLGIAVVSGATTAAGGLVARRIATAAARTGWIVLLSALVVTGITTLLVLATSAPVLSVVAGVAAGGFVTQAAIVPRRPWACGAGGGALVLFPLALSGWNVDMLKIAIAGLSGLFFMLIGTVGARLAWRFLLREDAPPSPDVPTARLG
jgi:hypothetical protein